MNPTVTTRSAFTGNPPINRSLPPSPSAPTGSGMGLSHRGSIRVYMLDDHPLYLQGMAAVLTAESGMLRVGQAETLAQAIADAPQQAPDVMVVDMVMTGRRGAETIATLRALLPRTRFVAMSCTLNPDDVRRTLAAGAACYLLKTATASELQAGVQAAFRGQQMLSPAVQAALAEHPAQPGVEAQLTPRERDLLGLLAQGLGNKAIAEALTVSIPTVKFHVTNILWKLRADNRTEAVVKALQSQIVSLQ